MKRERLTIVLSGMLAGVPRQGGATWAVLQYLLGLARLGHDVWFVEPVAGEAALPRSRAARYFAAVVERFGLEDRAALVDAATGTTVGVDRDRLQRAADDADLLLNVSGMLADDDLLDRIAVRAFVDLDPGFTQLWHDAEGLDLGLARHNRFVTIGHSIGAPGSRVPACGREWITTLQPIVLDHWPVDEGPARWPLTTVGHWRAYGSIEHDGTFYGQKAHSVRALLDLPARSSVPVVLALGIHPDETADLDALRRSGWRLEDPDAVAGTPDRYRRFVRGSWGELGLAKSGYVAAACGWFSDRSLCYLASGRPVIAQDTGFSAFLPTDAGLRAFVTAADAVAAIEEVRRDYPAQRRAARAVAEELFDSDRVLSRLLACL
jgi:hypothetical protein